MILWIWILLVAGAGLVLTQSLLTASFRGWLAKRSCWVAKILSKLISCPMCAGFWIGLGGALGLGFRGAEAGALAFGGSIVSALSVSLWLSLGKSSQPWACGGTRNRRHLTFMRSDCVWQNGWGSRQSTFPVRDLIVMPGVEKSAEREATVAFSKPSRGSGDQDL